MNILLLAGLTSFYACRKDKLSDDISAEYTGYFPLQAGHWIEYDVDSIVHLDTDDAFYLDTAIRIYSFQIREEIDSSFMDAENKLAWRISRYIRYDSNAPWQFLNLWTARLNPESVHRVEDNIRYVKLSFPPDPRKTWNGNAYNSFPPEIYSYRNLHSGYQVGSLQFDSSLTVIQNDFVSNINRINKQEVYAKNAGLISKTSDSLRTVFLPSGSVLILNGFEYSLRVIDYKR